MAVTKLQQPADRAAERAGFPGFGLGFSHGPAANESGGGNQQPGHHRAKGRIVERQQDQRADQGAGRRYHGENHRLAPECLDVARRWLFAVISAAGALVRALILLALDNPSSRSMVPWLLVRHRALCGGTVVRAQEAEAWKAGVAGRPGRLLQFLAAIGGFFGAGVG